MFSDNCRDKNGLNTFYGKWMIVVIITGPSVEPSRLDMILLSARALILRISEFQMYRIVLLTNTRRNNGPADLLTTW